MPLGFQAKIEEKAITAGTYAAFLNVMTITLPPIDVGEEEVKELGAVDDSSNPDPVRRFEPTLQDPGTVKVEGYFTKAEYVRLRGLAGTKRLFKITHPDDGTSGTPVPTVAEGPGFIKNVGEVKFEKDALVKTSFEIRPSKKWTFT